MGHGQDNWPPAEKESYIDGSKQDVTATRAFFSQHVWRENTFARDWAGGPRQLLGCILLPGAYKEPVQQHCGILGDLLLMRIPWPEK